MTSSPLVSPGITNPFLRDDQVFQGVSVGSVPITIKGVAGQTADIFRVQNSAGTNLMSIDASGNLTVAGTVNVVINQAVTGNLSLTGNLSVTGTSAFTGAVTAGAVTASGAFIANGTATFNNGATVSGTLTASNINIGGSFSIPSLTAGSVLIAGSGGSISQSTSLYFDTTNIRLGVGTNSPSATLGSSGGPSKSIHIATTSTTLDVGLLLSSAATGSGTYLAEIQMGTTGTSDTQKQGALIASQLLASSVSAITADLEFWTNNAGGFSEKMRITPAGKVGIGFTTVDYYLHVNGDGSFTTASGRTITLTDASSRPRVTLTNGSTIGFLDIISGGAMELVVTTANNLDLGTNNAINMTIQSGGLIGINQTVPTAQLHVVQAVNTSGSPTALLVVGGAHTTLAASTEAIDVNVNLARTVQFATGALTTQRAMVIQAPTYGFVGASVVTTASTAVVTGAPLAGTNATITNAFGLQVGGATTQVSASGLIYSAIDVPAHTVTITGTTQVTSVGPAGVRIGIVTLTDGSAVTVNNASSLYIAGAPAAAGSVTLTTARALWVDAGVSAFGGNITPDASDGAAIGTSALMWSDLFLASGGVINFNAGNVDITHSAATLTVNGVTTGMHVIGPLGAGGTSAYAQFTVTHAVTASGFTGMEYFNAAATSGVTSELETIYQDYNLAVTATYAASASAPAASRFVRYQSPTLAGATAITFPDVSTLWMDAPATAGSNATFTSINLARLGGTNVTVGATTAGFNYSILKTDAHTVTVTGSTQVTSTVGVAGWKLGIITVTDGSAVTIDNAASLYVAGAVAQAGSVTITNAYSMWVDAGSSRFDGRVLKTQGSDAASATNLTLGTDGNSFELTGTTKVDLISNVGWTEGSVVTLIANENVVIDHGTATSGTNVQIRLAGAVDYSMTAGDTLTLILSSTTAEGQAWREIARAVI